jgi:hypothetical protein
MTRGRFSHFTPSTSPTTLTSIMVPEIPERRSSTSSKKTSKKTGKRTRLEIEIERNDTENKAKAMRQALKPQASFSSAYWIQNAKIAITSKRSVELQKEISKQWGDVGTTLGMDGLARMVHSLHR